MGKTEKGAIRASFAPPGMALWIDIRQDERTPRSVTMLDKMLAVGKASEVLVRSCSPKLDRERVPRLERSSAHAHNVGIGENCAYAYVRTDPRAITVSAYCGRCCLYSRYC